MLSSVLGAAAVVFTVLRTYPQFLRIVIKKDRVGVSLSTWALALANHTGWLAYGVLSDVPLFIVANTLAGLGCAATVWVMRSGWTAPLVTLVTAAVCTGIYAISDATLLAAITALSLGMFMPQLVKVLRASAHGVSATAWTMAAMSSVTWISYALSIGRLTIVIAHFFMLPAALIILVRSIKPQPVAAGARAS